MLFTAIIEFLKKYETFMPFLEQDISFFNYSTAVVKDTDSYDFYFSIPSSLARSGKFVKIPSTFQLLNCFMSSFLLTVHTLTPIP